MIAAYYTEPAQVDCEAVTHTGAKLEGIICVSRDHAGELHVEESDHLARKGAEMLGGAGLVIGLFASLKKAVGEADGKKLAALKQALGEAQEKIKQPAQ